MARVSNPVYALDETVGFVTRYYGVWTMYGTIVPPVYAPVVSNITPTPGGNLHVNESIELDVTDDSGLFRLIRLDATLLGIAMPEAIWDGTAFTSLYSTSTSAPITNGYHFVITRTGGWPSIPTITPTAIDQLGTENV